MLKRLSKITALFFGFSILGLFFTPPLYKYLSVAIPHGGKGSLSGGIIAGDHLQIYYNLWHIAQNIFSGKLWDVYEFAVPGSSYSLSFEYFPVSYILSPLIFLLGPILTYNLFLLASFGLCGLFFYLLVRSYTQEPFGALLAGLLFAVCPYRLSQLFGGHINGFLCFYIPMALYAFERRSRILFLIALVAMYCADLQMLYFFLLIFTPYFILRLSVQAEDVKDFCRKLFPFALIYLGIFGLFLVAKMNLLSVTLDTGGREMHEVVSYPLSALIKKSPSSVGGNLYLGWIPFVLMALGMGGFLWNKNKVRMNFKSDALLRNCYFVVAAVLTLILSLGFTLDKSIPLYDWFYKHIPFFTFTRSPSRLFLLTQILMILLAGCAFSAFIKTLHQRVSFKTATRMSLLLFVVAVSLTIKDLNFFKHIALSRMDKPITAYRLLGKKHNPKGRVVFLPVFPDGDHFVSLYQYALTVSHWKMLQGYSAIPPASSKMIHEKLQPLHEGKTPPELVAFLQEQQVEYIVFHSKLYQRRGNFPDPNKVAQSLKNSPYLSLENTSPSAMLFRFSPGEGSQLD